MSLSTKAIQELKSVLKKSYGLSFGTDGEVEELGIALLTLVAEHLKVKVSSL